MSSDEIVFLFLRVGTTSTAVIVVTIICTPPIIVVRPSAVRAPPAHRIAIAPGVGWVQKGKEEDSYKSSTTTATLTSAPSAAHIDQRIHRKVCPLLQLIQPDPLRSLIKHLQLYGQTTSIFQFFYTLSGPGSQRTTGLGCARGLRFNPQFTCHQVKILKSSSIVAGGRSFGSPSAITSQLKPKQRNRPHRCF